MKKLLLALVLLLEGAGLGAHAQPAPAAIFGCVYNATTPTYADKQTPALQCDINGQLKTTGGGSSSSGSALNLTGINGVAPGAANPLYVAPGTGAVFTVAAHGVTQVTSPWVVSGSVTSTQGTLPWIVSATVTSITSAVTATSSYGDAQFAQAPFTIAASGNTQIVTRAVGTIKLFGFQMACAQATTATMRNGTGSGSALSGAMPLTTWFMPINNVPWFTTTSTNSLNLGIENSGPCNGVVYYRDN